MSVTSGQSVAIVWPMSTETDADSLPTAALYLNGVVNAAAVTVTHVSTGLYKYSVTLPTLATGDQCQICATAILSGVTGQAVIWRDSCVLPDVNVISVAGVPAQAAKIFLAQGTVVSDTGDVTTLDSNAANTPNIYVDSRLVVTHPTLGAQEAIITAYSSDRAASHAAWAVPVDNSWSYIIQAAKAPTTTTTPEVSIESEGIIVR